MATPRQSKFVLCIRNEDCGDLELRRVYRVLPDEKASLDEYLRIQDESGEDCLYPESHFVAVRLSRKAEEAVLASQA